ncbi:uncharacterized protein LOC144866085 [Branchiostoma floridae x Branchiostoma japonicum]
MLKAHLVLIPSETEPFELVGLDAIAAGIPVLMSDKSGLADFMKKISKEFYHSTVPMEGNEEYNVKQWARCIEQVLSNCEAEFERAARCRDELLSAKYWEESHQKFIDSCLQTGDSEQQTSKGHTMSVPAIEEYTEGSKPVKPGNRTQQPEVQKRKRSPASIGETIKDSQSKVMKSGEPPILPIEIKIILEQVRSNVKTAEDMVNYAVAKETLYTIDITADDTHEMLQKIKSEVRTISDLLNVVKAIQTLEKLEGIKVSHTGPGSIVFYLQCRALNGLGELWFMYKNGKLNDLLVGSLISEETLQQFCAESISVKTTINIEDFRTALVYLLTTSMAKGNYCI